MARTFLRQDTQIRNSDSYDDTVAPTLANFETNPANIETDLNNIRSMLSHLLDVQAGNWYDTVNTPSALDTGSQRGVNDLNTDLHALERKRVLVKSATLADVSVGASTAATGTLTLTGNVSNGDQVETGGKTYTFQTVLTDVDGNVLIGATASDSIDNLIAAINLGAGSGSTYAASTTANGSISAAAGAGDTMDATALKSGTFGNTISTTDPTDGGAVMSWGAATLTGGAGGDVVILGSGELPNNTTAAVGAVTTQGTVVAPDTGTFGEASLAEVAGSNAIAPKNFVEVVDGATRDPVTDASSRRIYGLLQGESGVTDGVTITDTTTTRVQVSFVVITSAGDDLETVDGADLGGSTINLCFTERKAMEDLTEQDFLRGAVTDVPGSSVENRQNVYDNQGITPVDVTTDSFLDLEGAGLEWTIRDDLEAALLRVIEGSAGGTSTIEIGSDVDNFDVDAADNDFLNGASFDTGAAGTTINVGVTANQIDSGGALTVASGASSDLTFDATGGEMLFDDVYRASSSYTTQLLRLADSAQEWSDFETAFGSEVSLLAAITEAANTTGITKVCANVTAATIAADTDVSGPSNDNNIDADLGDLSGGTFVDDHDVFLNGALLRSGASAAANNDVYPGTALANGQLKFEFVLKVNDVLCVMSRA